MKLCMQLVSRFTRIITAAILAVFIALPSAVYAEVVPMPGCDAVDDVFTFSGDMPPNNAFSGTVVANDTLGDAASGTAYSVGGYLSRTTNGGTVLVNQHGQFNYLPPNGFVGDDEFYYELAPSIYPTKPYPTCDRATVTLHVSSPGYQRMVARDDAVSTLDTSSAYISTGINDLYTTAPALQPNVIQYDPVATPLGTFYRVSGPLASQTTFRFDPVRGASGVATMAYTLSDGYEYSSTATIRVTITPNSPPQTNPDTYTTDEDTAFSGNVLANDVDAENDVLKVASPSQPTNGNVAVQANGDFTYTPHRDFNGSDSFTYEASDGYSTATQTVTVTVVSVNDAPVAVDSSISTKEDVGYSGNLSPSSYDVDSGSLTYSLSLAPLNGVVVMNSDGSYTYTPALNYSGSDSFRYSVSDGSLTATAEVSILVEPVNDAPIASFSVSRTKSKTYTFDGSASKDIEGPMQYYSWDFGDGTSVVTYQPTVAHTYRKMGTYTVMLTVTDYSGATDTTRQTVSTR